MVNPESVHDDYDPESVGQQVHDESATVLHDRMNQLTAINTVAAIISQSLDLDVVLQTALAAVLDVIRVEAAGISLVDENTGELVLRAQWGWKHDFVTQPMRIPLGQGLSGWVIANDEMLITGDVSDDPRLAVPEFLIEGVQAQALVPMHAHGHVVGVLSVMSYSPYDFSQAETTLLTAIADQVGMALDNARLYENVKEQSSRLNAILQSTSDAVIATDSRGIINLINSAAEDLFDLRVKEFIGLPLREAPLHPRLRSALQRGFFNADKEEGSSIFEVTLEDDRFLSVTLSPVYTSQAANGSRHSGGWVMVIRDVTHLREAEQTRVNFVQAAAHDLRNPISSAMGVLVMLRNELEGVSEVHREVIDIGLQSINRMQDLIDDLLNLEQISSGVDLHHNPVDMREVIERGFVDIQPSTQGRKQTVCLDVPPALSLIEGDTHWLYRALFNLLTNASKYTQPGGTITIRARQTSDELIVEVEDDGPGIALETQSRLFERFYRAPETKDLVRGTGLGLAIVKSVAEQHNGRVFVQSRVGQGSNFGLAFPLSDEDVSPLS